MSFTRLKIYSEYIYLFQFSLSYNTKNPGIKASAPMRLYEV